MRADSRQAFLLVASRNQIVQDDITAQPNVVRSLVRDGRNIVALDFDSATDRVYWSDTSQDRIWSANKNGTDRTVVSFFGGGGYKYKYIYISVYIYIFVFVVLEMDWLPKVLFVTLKHKCLTRSWRASG